MFTRRSSSTFVKIAVFSISVTCSAHLFLSVEQPVTPVFATPVELFFSEYVEGSSNNKALEIYNGTGGDITFNGEYAIEFYFNGNLTPGTIITLTGIISANDVFVIADNDAAQEILDQADQLAANQFFNGDDAIILRKNGNTIDAIGQVGNDPGNQWGNGVTSTKDNTLRRNYTIEAGDPDGSDSFEPSIEWNGFAKDTFSDLGIHAPPPPPPAIVINEVAWSGTQADANDEWIELHNPTTQTAILDGWIMTSTNGLNIVLSGSMLPDSYYLIERTDDTAITDMTANLTTGFGSGLSNDGTSLYLSAGSILLDTANLDGDSWPAGTNDRPDFVTSMERIDPLAPDTNDNWISNNRFTRNGIDKDGQPINGTPGQPNSPFGPEPPPPPLTIVINEVAWSGTMAEPAHEWLELYNTTTATLQLDGWTVTSTNGLSIPLNGKSIDPKGYFLIEAEEVAISDISANLIAVFGSQLNDSGDQLFLAKNDYVIDSANLDGSAWPAGTQTPDFFSMERIDPSQPDTDDNWINHNGLTRSGLDVNGQPINGTPGQPNSVSVPPPALPILIGEFIYDGLTPSSEGDEFVELCNPNDTPADLTGYKVGDEETAGGGESMYHLPDGTRLAVGACLVIAKSAADFQNRFGFLPDFEAGDLSKYTAWGRGSWSLSNDGDELLVVGPADQIFDSVAYRNGDYASLGLEAGATAPAPDSLQRVWPTDTDSMPHDFVRAAPNPGVLTAPPPPPEPPSSPALLADGLKAYWGHLHAHTTYSDGAGPPHYALAKARAAGLHFYGITDHAWWLNENEWLKTLPQVEAATVPGEFIALRGLEWTHDAVGHINLFNTNVLVSHENPLFSDLSGLYNWLAANPQVIAQFNHPDPKYGGTFADFAYHPAAAQVMFLQEIGNHAQTYTTYEPSFVQSNTVGWRVAPANNGDTHSALWGTDTQARTGIIAPELTTNALLEAMRQRRVFATEDSNLAVALRVDDQWMGSILNKIGDLLVTVDVVDLEAEAATVYLYDRNLLVATASVANNEPWHTQINARAGHYFWIKVIQTDGDRAYSAPVWIEGQAAAEMLYINEVLPSPGDTDWDGDGVADYQDEWIEIFNPTEQSIGLGGWQLSDSSDITYYMPLELSIPARGYLTLYSNQLGFALNNGEDTLTLQRPDNTIADTFSYSESPGYDESWCRLPDGNAQWSDDCIPSPDGQNWEREPAQPLEVKVYEAKRLTLDAWVRVSGQVTVPPGLLGRRVMYIQDETAGILVYLPKDHQLYFNLGDKVRIEGNLKQFRGEFEIVVSQRSKVKFIEPGSAPPPLPIETTMMLEPFEGRLVMLTGQAVQFKGRTVLWVDDGTDPAKVYIRSTTGIKKPFIEPGTPITVVGIVSQYSDPDNPSRHDYRLLPRYQTDLILEATPNVYEPTPPAILDVWPILLPETGNQVN